jgi:hypothetical protein
VCVTLALLNIARVRRAALRRYCTQSSQAADIKWYDLWLAPLIRLIIGPELSATPLTRYRVLPRHAQSTGGERLINVRRKKMRHERTSATKAAEQFASITSEAEFAAAWRPPSSAKELWRLGSGGATVGRASFVQQLGMAVAYHCLPLRQRQTLRKPAERSKGNNIKTRAERSGPLAQCVAIVRRNVTSRSTAVYVGWVRQ